MFATTIFFRGDDLFEGGWRQGSRDCFFAIVACGLTRVVDVAILPVH
jgi:hypothetical protein